jgi:hypothetical protein
MECFTVKNFLRSSKQQFSGIILLISFTLSLIACSNDGQSVLQPLSLGSYAVAPDTITIVVQNYRPQVGNVYQNMFVSNFSVKAAGGKLSLSSSRDSLTDSNKMALASQFGFNVGSAESVVTGFADLLLYNLGITSTQQSRMRCASSQMQSSSSDALIYKDVRGGGNATEFLGLRDCEKIYLGLKPTLFDSAGNGIPDYMKLRCGINPLDKNAAYISTAGDGVTNMEKCRRNIPLDESATSQPNQLFSYHYDTQLNSDGSTDLKISNIPILNGGEANFIALYVTETSLNSSTPSLYTAFMILKAGYGGKTIKTPYWATSPATFSNQEITLP